MILILNSDKLTITVNCFFSVPIILVGNKSDLQSDRRVTSDEGKNLAAEMKAVFLETSAKENQVNLDPLWEVYNQLLCLYAIEKRKFYYNALTTLKSNSWKYYSKWEILYRAHFGNYGHSLSYFFGKKFVKVTAL